MYENSEGLILRGPKSLIAPYAPLSGTGGGAVAPSEVMESVSVAVSNVVAGASEALKITAT
jgi:hypothetical protein